MSDQVGTNTKLVFEEYFHGYPASQVHDTRSLAKVFGSMLVGAAQQQGFDISPSFTPMPQVLKDNGLNVSSQRSSITLEHFLTHTSGLDMSEDGRSPGSEDRLWSQQDQDFWLYTAKLPVVHPPGERYSYASAGANMVGAAIEQVTGQSVRTFFHHTLASPLNFAPYHWNLTLSDPHFLISL